MLFVHDKHGLPREEFTIAEMLKPLGYRSAIIGKWHLGHTSEHWPTTQGFDYYYGLPYSNNQSPLALYRDNEKIEEPVKQATLTQRYTAEAIHFIEQNRDQPFFVYLPHTAPHVPLTVPEAFTGKSRGGLYGDVVESLDWSMGELLDALQRLGLDEQTLVIFTSDNGPYPQGSSGGLRGSKGTPWEGGYRVPFIARWPGIIPAGAISNGIAMNIDLPADAAGHNRSPFYLRGSNWMVKISKGYCRGVQIRRMRYCITSVTNALPRCGPRTENGSAGALSRHRPPLTGARCLIVIRYAERPYGALQHGNAST